MDQKPKNNTYNKLSSEVANNEKISVTPKVRDGKLLFNKSDKDHQYIVGELKNKKGSSNDEKK